MNYCNCPNCQTANCPNAQDEPPSEAAVQCSALVVLLDQWNQDVIKWERAADNTEPDSWTVRDRCRARASEIARCRRELAEVVKQHNDQGQRAGAGREETSNQD